MPRLDTKSYFVAYGRVPCGAYKQDAGGATSTYEKNFVVRHAAHDSLVIFTLLFLVTRCK
jgi:hypothetical protein